MALKGDGGTWQRQMSRLLGWEGPDMRWHRTERSGRRFADSAVSMTATKMEVTVQQLQHKHRQFLFMLLWALILAARRPHPTADSVMAHNIRATERDGLHF